MIVYQSYMKEDDGNLSLVYYANKSHITQPLYRVVGLPDSRRPLIEWLNKNCNLVLHKRDYEAPKIHTAWNLWRVHDQPDYTSTITTGLWASSEAAVQAEALKMKNPKIELIKVTQGRQRMVKFMNAYAYYIPDDVTYFKETEFKHAHPNRPIWSI